jgi:hypothetical protein
MPPARSHSLDDLESVATMGFRGEALAAIASVSELRCSRAPPGAGQSATLLDARSGELRPVARAVGTTVEVRELFFSTPARRKFLKTDATELAHCVEAVRRHALARPDVGFAIWHEGKLVRAVAHRPDRRRDAQRWTGAWPTCWAPTSSSSRWLTHQAVPAASLHRPRRPAGRGARPRRPAVLLRQRPLRARQGASPTPPAAPTKTCCTASASRSMRCTSTSTRRGWT